MKKLVVALCATLGVVSCTAEQPIDGDGGPVRPSLAREDDGCVDQRNIVDTQRPLDGGLEGDVDGDGETDEIFLVLGDGGAGCRAFVVVRTETTTASEPVWEVGSQGGLPQPRLQAVAQIDGEGGVEVIVDEMAGASTQFVGVFTFLDGTLERIEPAEPATDIWAGAAEGVFPYGGSVGHVEAVDCTDEGEIVVSVALPGETRRDLERGIYTVTRRFFRIEGAELVATRDQKKEIEFDFGATYPEFGSSPFGSCPTK